MSNNDQSNNESQDPEQGEDSLSKLTSIARETFNPIPGTEPGYVENRKQDLMGITPSTRAAMMGEMQQSRQVPPPPQQTLAEQLRPIIQEELAQTEQRILAQVRAMLDQLWEELTRGDRGANK